VRSVSPRRARDDEAVTVMVTVTGGEREERTEGAGTPACAGCVREGGRERREICAAQKSGEAESGAV
jgi:hypothetical protein